MRDYTAQPGPGFRFTQSGLRLLDPLDRVRERAPPTGPFRSARRSTIMTMASDPPGLAIAVADIRAA
jgi:hypothetical protein